MSAANETIDPGLVRWTSLPEHKQALAFTAQGWAMVEVCAVIGEFQKPQQLIGQMLGQIINGFVEHDTNRSGGELQVSWRMPDNGLTATVSFETEALKGVAAACDMELGELQSAIQSSLELSLLELYKEHNDAQRLH